MPQDKKGWLGWGLAETAREKVSAENPRQVQARCARDDMYYNPETNACQDSPPAEGGSGDQMNSLPGEGTTLRN